MYRNGGGRFKKKVAEGTGKVAEAFGKSGTRYEKLAEVLGNK